MSAVKQMKASYKKISYTNKTDQSIGEEINGKFSVQKYKQNRHCGGNDNVKYIERYFSQLFNFEKISFAHITEIMEIPMG